MTIELCIAKLVKTLESRHFFTEIFSGSNNCFDIIAKNGSLKIIIKVYENIDSIRKEQGEELKKLSNLLGAACVIIGERTKVFALQNGTVYYRYDIPAVTLETFEKILSEDEPFVKYFKGKSIVEIDFSKIRQGREKMNMTPEELAQSIGVSQESMYRFEKGASTTLETALKLEKQLKEKLIKSINFFEKEEKEFVRENPQDELLGKINELGIELALFRHSPFKAYSDSESGIFIETGKGKFDIPKKAIELKKTSTIIDSDSIIITKEYKVKSVNGVPIIGQEELESISRPKDLKKMIREREKN